MEVQVLLKEKGVSIMVYYSVPLHKDEGVRGQKIMYSPLPNAEAAAEEFRSLPRGSLMNDGRVDYVISTVRKSGR